jgi:hypothetical protein
VRVALDVTTVPDRGVFRLPQVAPGLRLGEYELIRLLGKGGMGQVWLARDTKLARLVAIKFLLYVEPGGVERFEREALATARCHHENIVVIHDVGTFSGTPFLVLEYLEGTTFRELLDSGAQPESRVVALMTSVLRALMVAHAHGIVHRDLKPDNIFLTTQGSVKVVDFGVAKGVPTQSIAVPADALQSDTVTRANIWVGTPAYMSPERLNSQETGPDADLWAVGIILFELMNGCHPLGSPVTVESLLEVLESGERLPSAKNIPNCSPELAAIIDQALQRDKSLRFPDAETMLRALVSLQSSTSPATGDDFCPYPGLAAFSESDGDHYFGREADVRRGLLRLEDRALLTVLGPSGAGKSSFVRAGLFPALKHGGERWECLTLRPGRAPLRMLARTILEGGTDVTQTAAALAERLPAEPGLVGTILRARALRDNVRIALLVDQLEELYTAGSSAEEQRAFLACLVGCGDDVESPLRVIVTMRSDFVDRVAHGSGAFEQFAKGFLFLSPLDRAGLHQALTRPAEAQGYRFESPALVDEILHDLLGSPSALPLLQFLASKLWDRRNRFTRVFATDTYRELGGVDGALVTHANQVLADQSPESQIEMRRILQLLVTPERTRAIVEMSSVLESSPQPERTRQVIEELVRARLLVVHSEETRPTVEIIHEALIESWPLLRLWMEEEREAIAFVAEIRAAAGQWEAKGRPQGLLWRGEALVEGKRFLKLHADRKLAQREHAFLQTALALEARTQRRRRLLAVVAFVTLAVIAGGAVVAMLAIQKAEGRARVEAERARDEAERALSAERDMRAEKERAEAERASREAAEKQAQTATIKVTETQEDLKKTNEALQASLRENERETARARAAEVKVKELLRERERELESLKQKLRRISTELKE